MSEKITRNSSLPTLILARCSPLKYRIHTPFGSATIYIYIYLHLRAKKVTIIRVSVADGGIIATHFLPLTTDSH